MRENMDFVQEYEKIRPYYDNEVNSILNEIIKKEEFQHILSYLYDDKCNTIEKFKPIKTVFEFQSVFSHYAVRKIIKKTSDGLSYSGIENLDNRKAYLFIANHRDIVLDSAIMQMLLVENNHKTSQITFGSNLMSSDFIIKLGKLNKMFTFYRGKSPLQLYRNSLLHSKYIQHVITTKNESIWIAQRDGRTKDGNDKTQKSLIKMLTMGKPDIQKAIQELNIVPVTISYEYEPCDSLKIQELYISKRTKYVKQENEDFESVLKGITGYKGHIHFVFGEPLNSKMEFDEKEINEDTFIEKVVSILNSQMYNNYALWPTNYIAYDYITGQNQYCNVEYDENQKQNFTEYINNKVSSIEGDKKELTDMFFRMYAMPVVNITTLQKK